MNALTEHGGVAAAAVRVIQGLLESAGINADAATVIRLAGELVQAGVELLEGDAKKRAEAAGDAAADKITTVAQAEESARNR
jgi:hypothetical protein